MFLPNERKAAAVFWFVVVLCFLALSLVGLYYPRFTWGQTWARGLRTVRLGFAGTVDAASARFRRPFYSGPRAPQRPARAPVMPTRDTKGK